MVLDRRSRAANGTRRYRRAIGKLFRHNQRDLVVRVFVDLLAGSNKGTVFARRRHTGCNQRAGCDEERKDEHPDNCSRAEDARAVADARKREQLSRFESAASASERLFDRFVNVTHLDHLVQRTPATRAPASLSLWPAVTSPYPRTTAAPPRSPLPVG